MSRKNLFQIAAIILVVAGFYLYLFRDSFRRPHIHIVHAIRSRSTGRRRAPAAANASASVIVFSLGQEYKLTSVKVVPLEQFKTNKYAHPVWELVTKSNSIPTQAFFYGVPIRGMHPPDKGASPDPLAPNVPYRLFVQAGTLTGEHDFTIAETNRLNP